MVPPRADLAAAVAWHGTRERPRSVQKSVSIGPISGCSSRVKLRILAIGKPKLRYAADGIAEFRKRLQRSCPVEIAYLKDQDESRALLDRSAQTYRIALDERGERLTTDELVHRVNALEQRGDVKTVTFLVGGADGHSDELRRQSDLVLSLSSLTMQHELALVVLLEQLYRVFSIKRGEPYHRP